MTEAPSRIRLFQARLAVVLTIGMILLGTIWYGFPADDYQRIWRDILARAGGPMTFRFILQPTMAAAAAIHDGIKGAHLGRSPYFWAPLHDQGEFGARLREGLISTARIVLLGLGIDTLYQHRVLKTLYPGDAVVMALLLAVLPYLLPREPATWLVRWWSRHSLHVRPNEERPRQ